MGLPFQDMLASWLGYDPDDPPSEAFGGQPTGMPYQDLARRPRINEAENLLLGFGALNPPPGALYPGSMSASGAIDTSDSTAAPVTRPVVIPHEDVDHPDTIARYPDGMPILDRIGNPMQKPPFLDLGLALGRAQDFSTRPLWTDRLPTLFGLLHQGGDWDYHRSGGTYLPQYRDVANYMVGAVPAAANVPKWLSDLAGVVYSLGTTTADPWRDQKMWDQGRSDYVNNRLSFPGVMPAGPPMTYPAPTMDDVLQGLVPPF